MKVTVATTLDSRMSDKIIALSSDAGWTPAYFIRDCIQRAFNDVAQDARATAKAMAKRNGNTRKPAKV